MTTVWKMSEDTRYNGATLVFWDNGDHENRRRGFRELRNTLRDVAFAYNGSVRIVSVTRNRFGDGGVGVCVNWRLGR